MNNLDTPETTMIEIGGIGSNIKVYGEKFGDWAVHPVVTRQGTDMIVLLDAWAITHIPSVGTAGWCDNYAGAVFIAMSMPKAGKGWKELIEQVGGSLDLDHVPSENYSKLSDWNREKVSLAAIDNELRFQRGSVTYQ